MWPLHGINIYINVSAKQYILMQKQMTSILLQFVDGSKELDDRLCFTDGWFVKDGVCHSESESRDALEPAHGRDGFLITLLSHYTAFERFFTFVYSVITFPV